MPLPVMVKVMVMSLKVETLWLYDLLVFPNSFCLFHKTCLL